MSISILIGMDDGVKAVRYMSLKKLKKTDWFDREDENVIMRDDYVLTALDRGDPEILDWLLNEKEFAASSIPSPYRCLGVWPGCKYGQSYECREILIDYLYRTEKNIPTGLGGYVMPPGCLLEGYFDMNDGNNRKMIRKYLGEVLNIKPSWIDDLLIGSRRIHPLTAYRMESGLSIPSSMVMRLQIAYEYTMIQKKGIDPFSIYPEEFTKPATEIIFVSVS